MRWSNVRSLLETLGTEQLTAPWQAYSSRLVGRGGELDRLRRLLEDMESTVKGRMVLVHGEAGVGKSRLVREATAVARRAGVSVFSGRAVPSGEAYRPLAEALSAADAAERLAIAGAGPEPSTN